MDNNTQNRILHNCDKRIFIGGGQYDSPPISPVDMRIDDVQMLGFNYALSCEDQADKVCHFFLDDYQFQRVWFNPDKYLDVLRKFKAVLSPDFSMYSDFPYAVSLYNHYRKQWCGAYWQEHGITVIPTVCWGDERSYDYCFDGIPRNALVCISTVGSFAIKENRQGWLDGYHEALRVLKPNKIIFYGKLYPEIDITNGIEYSVAKNANMSKLSQIRDKKRKEEREKRK